jgi:hypothetical protein
MPREYSKDPYKILGIPPTATTHEVKQAFHKLARENHPDLNKDPRAAERMKEINWANDILGDPQEREAYDSWKASGFQETDFSDTYSYRGYSEPSQRSTTYGNGSTIRNIRTVGCTTGPILWILFTLLINLIRGIGSWAQPNTNFSMENPSTQAVMMEQLDSAIETLHATQEYVLVTPQPSNPIPATPSPVESTPTEDLSGEDIRSQIIPGTWIWEQLALHYPELTTLTGLSDEVTHVAYDQLGTYKIRTKSLGEYWLVTDSSNEVVVPIHFPPSFTVTPSP